MTMTLAMVALKTTDVIDWPWFWLLLPVTFPLFVFVSMVVLTIAVTIALRAFDDSRDRTEHGSD